MPTLKKTATGIGLLAVAGAIAAVGSGPLLVGAADHLDAPTAKSDHRIDITDIYAFRSTGGTTLVLNVNPLTSPADTKTALNSKARPDQDRHEPATGSPTSPIASLRQHPYAPTAPRVQDYTVKRATGAAARTDAGPGPPWLTGPRRPTAPARVASSPAAASRSSGRATIRSSSTCPGFVEFK